MKDINRKAGAKNRVVLLIAVVFMVVVIAILFYCSGSTGRQLRKQLDLGFKYLSEQDYDQAIASFKKVLEIDPNNIEAYSGIINTYGEIADCETGSKKEDAYKAAIEYAEVLHEKAHNNITAQRMLVTAYINLADYYYDSKNYESAEEYYEKSISVPVDASLAYLQERAKERLEEIEKIKAKLEEEQRTQERNEKMSRLLLLQNLKAL